MKIYVGGLVGLILTVVFSSCQREVNEVLPNRVNTNDSIYLDKAIVFDTTLPPGMDTIEKDIFKYDNQKRLINYTVNFFPVYLPDTLLYEYFYLNSDSLPYKMVYQDIYLSGSVLNHSLDTTYYTYTNGMVSKDSTISWELSRNHNFGAAVSQYSVQGNTGTIYFRKYDYSSGIYLLTETDTSACTVVYSAGNLISQTRTSGHTAVNSLQASYDNKISPFARVIKIKYPFSSINSGFGLYSQINNPLTVHSQETPSDPFEDATYTYTYRTDGYPVKGTLYSSSGFGSVKFLYIYKSL